MYERTATLAVTLPYGGMVFVLEPLLNDTADARVGDEKLLSAKHARIQGIESLGLPLMC